MRQHARRYRPSLRARARFAIVSRWPLRWWWRLSPATRDWWVEEYHRRHGFSTISSLGRTLVYNDALMKALSQPSIDLGADSIRVELVDNTAADAAEKGRATMHTTIDAHAWADNPPAFTVTESPIGNGTVILTVDGYTRDGFAVSTSVHLYFHGREGKATGADLVRQLRDAIDAYLGA